MALTSTFYDGVVTESDRAKNLAGSPEYGVYGPEDFKVTAHPSIPYAVLVKAGRAHGHGVTDDAAEDQVVQCAPIASGVRWDLIIVRRNWQPELGGPSTLEVIEAGAEPQIPAGRLVGPGIEDDQPIFLVKWQGGVSAPVDFRDLRVWAKNGGLFAKQDLVRSYMNSVGTEININGTVWAYQLGTNDVPAWVKLSETGKIPLFGFTAGLDGGVPPAGTSFLEQRGTSSGNTNDLGSQRLTWPKPFPNGLLSLVLMNGDPYSSGLGATIAPAGGSGYGSSGGGNRFDVVYEVIDKDGNKLPNRPHRVNFIATGW